MCIVDVFERWVSLRNILFRFKGVVHVSREKVFIIFVIRSNILFEEERFFREVVPFLIETAGVEESG